MEIPIISHFLEILVNLYPFFYKKVITHLPDKWVEKSGGPFFSFASNFVWQKTPDMPVKVGSHIFKNPTGIPAGWVDHPQKIRTMKKLGAGIIVVKTITPEKKPGNPYPRLVRMNDSLINSMGLPNLGLEWWENNYQPINDFPSIISIKGNNFEEWVELIEKLEKKTEIFELNLSCPNVSSGIMDIHESIKLVEEIAGITNTDLLLKLSPEYSGEQNTEFIAKVRDKLLGVSAINTLPTSHQKLGNPTKIGGLSGLKIRNNLITQLSTIRSEFKTFSELPIFASGGINDPEFAWVVLSKYKSLPLSLTGFLINGPLQYTNILNTLHSKINSMELTVGEILNNSLD